jgi:hypothetical protein
MKKLFLIVSAAFLFGGCFSADNKEPQQVAQGGDDYPNGVQPLGKKAAQAHNDSADWNGFKTAPRTSPGMYDTVHVPDSTPDTTKPKSPAPTPTPKRAASSRSAELPLPPLDTVVTHVIDTAKGTVETVHTQVTDTATHIDSTVLAPADTGKPGSKPGVMSVAGKIVYADSGHFLAYRFTDADGDGLLAPRAGSANIVKAELSTGLAGGEVEKRSLLMAAGQDLDFNAAGDNQLLASAFVRMQGADTLDVFKLLSADGDAIVIDFSKDTNLVDLIETHRILSGPVAEVTRKVRLVVFSKDSTRNYPVAFSEKRLLRDGGIIDIRARGAGSDSLFLAGEEALWTESRFRPAGDTESAAVTYRVRLADQAGAFAGDSLLGVAVEESYRKDPARFSFDFLCDAPVSDGKRIGKGDLVAWLAFQSGYRVTFTGAAGATASAGFTGRVTGSDGKSSAIVFDAAGQIVAPAKP